MRTLVAATARTVMAVAIGWPLLLFPSILLTVSSLAGEAGQGGPLEPAAAEAADAISAARASLERAAKASAPQLPGTRAADAEQARQEFLAWQMQMLQQRASMPPELARVLKKRTYVPEPMPSDPSANPAKEPAKVVLDVPLFPDPTGLFAKQYLQVSVGRPDMYFGLNASAKAAEMIGVTYRKGAGYVAERGSWKPTETLEVSGARKRGEDQEYGLSYQFWAGEGGPHSGSAGYTFSYLRFDGSVGLDNEGRVALAGVYKFAKTPEVTNKLLEASAGFEFSANVPVALEGAPRKESSRLADFSAAAVRRLSEKLAGQRECPHCRRRGEVTCGTCKDARRVTCPQCQGKLTFACKRCEGGGHLYCTSCENHSGRAKCWDCSGSGQLRCRTCSGSGSVSQSEWVDRTYKELVVTQAGFDASGQPIYDRHYETRTRSELVSKTVACGACGGSGKGGACGRCGASGLVVCTRCGGGGIVGCNSCNATGKVPCGKCRGKGQIDCRECRGKPIVCPLCRGEKVIGGGK